MVGNLYIYREKGTRLCSVNFSIPVGYIHETENYKGITHLIEHLIFHGHSRLSQNEIMQYFEEHGGIINAATEACMTTIYLRIDKAFVKESMEIIYDCILNFNINIDDVNKEIRIIDNENNLLKRKLYPYIICQTNKLFYNGHPYSRGLTTEHAEYAMDEIFMFYRSYYAIEEWIIVLFGDVDEQLYEYDQSGSGFKKILLPVNNTNGIIHRESKLNYAASIWALNKIENVDICLRLWRALCSKGMSSPLYSKLILEEGIGYNIFFSNNNFFSHSSFIIALLTNDSLAVKEEYISDLFYDLIIEKKFSNNDYERALNSFNTEVSLLYENKGRLAKLILEHIILFNEEISIDKYVKVIKKLTVSSVKDLIHDSIASHDNLIVFNNKI